MGTTIVYTKERMQQIENTTIVGGAVNAMGNLMLTARDGSTFDAGKVKGDQGDPGAQGPAGILAGTAAQRDSRFGIPGTVAQQVALANQSPTWYNITTGGFETYMGATGSAGLNVPGNTTAGWVPMGAGPSYEKLGKGLVARYVNAGTKTGLNASWNLVDYLTVSLVAGRWYRATVRLNSSCTGEGGLAYAVELRTNATTESPVTEVGNFVDDIHIAYTSQVPGQGKSENITFMFKAATTGTVNLKLVATRAAGNSTFDFVNRKIHLFDEGTTVP